MHKIYSSLRGLKDIFFVGKGIPCFFGTTENIEETDKFEQKDNQYPFSYGNGESISADGDGYFFEIVLCYTK